MQPISEFKERLFVSAGADPNRILHFSCDHVIPEDNLLPMVICKGTKLVMGIRQRLSNINSLDVKGPTGRTLDFSFESRNAVDTMKELCSVLSNVCNIVPGGIVCFLPSYEYEHKLFKFLEDNGKVSSLQQRKPIFREPKKSTDLESVLHKYRFGSVLYPFLKTSRGITESHFMSLSYNKLVLPRRRRELCSCPSSGVR